MSSKKDLLVEPQPGEWFVATTGNTVGCLWIYDPRTSISGGISYRFAWRVVDTRDITGPVCPEPSQSGRFADNPDVIAAHGLVRLNSTSPKAPEPLRLSTLETFYRWKRDNAVDPDQVHDATTDDDVNEEPEAPAWSKPDHSSMTVVSMPGGGGGGGGGDGLTVTGPAAGGQPGGGWSVLAANLDKARDWTAWAFAEAAWWKQGADLVAALTALGEGSKALADSELKRLRDELDDAVDAREHAIGLRNAAIRERDELRAELAMAERALHAEAAITRVRELHQPFVEVDWAEAPYCGTCACVREYGLTYEPWPCPTIRALNGDTDA